MATDGFTNPATLLGGRAAGNISVVTVRPHMTAQVSIDLSGAHLSYSDFEDASFQGNGAIKLDGAGLAHADLSGLTVSAVGEQAQTIDFSGANLAHADLSRSKLTAAASKSSDDASLIDFAGADLSNANLRDSKFTAEIGDDDEDTTGGARECKYKMYAGRCGQAPSPLGFVAKELGLSTHRQTYCLINLQKN